MNKVQALARQLWPEESLPLFDGQQVFVWEREDGVIGGFASVSIRPFVDGVDAAPCPHVEGWFVEPAIRQSGAGRALIYAIEEWCRQRGFAT
ncbi:MAG: GNAT family N-acetyltransferase, partial [Methylocapsa sp.]|nr:GNAT family N-acetyltransferase [Methylocapsa sp.]